MAVAVTFCTTMWSLRQVSGSMSFSVISFMPISFPGGRGRDEGRGRGGYRGQHLGLLTKHQVLPGWEGIMQRAGQNLNHQFGETVLRSQTGPSIRKPSLASVPLPPRPLSMLLPKTDLALPPSDIWATSPLRVASQFLRGSPILNLIPFDLSWAALQPTFNSHSAPGG